MGKCGASPSTWVNIRQCTLGNSDLPSGCTAETLGLRNHLTSHLKVHAEVSLL